MVYLFLLPFYFVLPLIAFGKSHEISTSFCNLFLPVLTLSASYFYSMPMKEFLAALILAKMINFYPFIDRMITSGHPHFKVSPSPAIPKVSSLPITQPLI